MVLVGVIKRVYSYGVFIEFPNGLVGLAPLKYLSDEYITETNGVYGDRQTVFAKVIILLFIITFTLCYIKSTLHNKCYCILAKMARRDSLNFSDMYTCPYVV